MAGKYLSNLKKLFFHPSHFFKSIEQETSYSGAMFFYVKITLISVVISLIISISSLISSSASSTQSFVNSFINAVTTVGLAFIIPFAVSGVAQLGVWIFRGKQGYINTYKAMSYPLAITVIYGIITMIILLIKNAIMPISIPADVQDYATLFSDKNFVSSMIISVVILAISMIHMLVAQVIGLSKFQKISKLKSFFAIILIPLILGIIAAILLVKYANQAGIA